MFFLLSIPYHISLDTKNQAALGRLIKKSIQSSSDTNGCDAKPWTYREWIAQKNPGVDALVGMPLGKSFPWMLDEYFCPENAPE